MRRNFAIPSTVVSFSTTVLFVQHIYSPFIFTRFHQVTLQRVLISEATLAYLPFPQ